MDHTTEQALGPVPEPIFRSGVRTHFFTIHVGVNPTKLLLIMSYMLIIVTYPILSIFHCSIWACNISAHISLVVIFCALRMRVRNTPFIEHRFDVSLIIKYF